MLMHSTIKLPRRDAQPNTDSASPTQRSMTQDVIPLRDLSISPSLSRAKDMNPSTRHVIAWYSYAAAAEVFAACAMVSQLRCY